MSDAFAVAAGLFDALCGWLGGESSAGLSHHELEDQLDTKGRELLRQLFQEHLELRAVREPRLEVTDSDSVAHGRVEPGHTRRLATIFGEVTVTRIAYRHPGHPNLCPADAALNLPVGLHSHGLRLRAALEASRGSFDSAAQALERATGVHVGKRQVEALSAAAAVDVGDFYAGFAGQRSAAGDVIVLSVDGKGIIVRPDDLRAGTARHAQSAKLDKRLSKGERRYRKRMAEVGAVYDICPAPRTPADVLASHSDLSAAPGPKAKNKWVTASVVDDAATVVAEVFHEADQRDPGHQRVWIGLVDGNAHQIDRIHAEADQRAITVRIVIDFIHVLEYLWGAVWCFFAEGDPAAEAWVRDRVLAILEGKAGDVAAGIRRRASTEGLSAQKRKKADDCAKYLTNKAPYLDYPTALASGWPIATGIIEGACRHLVADRMDITGARWSASGAEAILKLRALHTNGDLDAYWP
ncbi:MAG: ISKra4 family transposase, partial [Acidimicrobiales bacterium]